MKFLVENGVIVYRQERAFYLLADRCPFYTRIYLEKEKNENVNISSILLWCKDCMENTEILYFYILKFVV